MGRPLISALIDTYNHERFIEQAILSVLDQDISPSDMEILVVDDGSTDTTPEIVRKFAPRVRYLQKPNGGQASAFNVGIPETRGEIIAMLDGDDWWVREKLKHQLETLAANPDVGIVGHGHFEADRDGHVYGTVFPGRSGRLDLSSPAAARQFSNLRGFFGTTKMAVRRWVLERILPVPEELVIEADEYIFMLAPALAPAYLLDEALFYYRFHGGNLFQNDVYDEGRARRKGKVLACLASSLPPRLAEFGVPKDVSDALLESLRLDSARTRLTLDGGSPLETFQVERASYHINYRKMTIGYHAFRALALSLALVLPPRWFYSFRRWYTASGLAKARAQVAHATPSESVVESRPGS
jgi:glycosyltransferase involved in cell wall biosynthesis